MPAEPSPRSSTLSTTLNILVALVATPVVLMLAILFLFTGAGASSDSQIIGLIMLGVGFFAVAIWARNSRLWARRALLAVLLCALGAGALSLPAALRDRYLVVEAPEPEMRRYAPFRAPFEEISPIARLGHKASLQLGPEALPRLDGATALYPLYAAFVEATWPELDLEALQAQMQVNKTSKAYERLFSGEADMIFVAAPSKAQAEKARAAGLDLTLTPIGREAFVFYVSSKNPVTGLSQAQIRGIYSGAITNWADLGGKRRKITAFQRPEGSGSQSMLARVMGDTPLMAAPAEEVVDGMGGIVSRTADFRAYPGAIGYSFRVFVANILQADAIRLLEIDGVAPTPATISDASYPFALPFYVATLGPPEGAAQEFINWIVSPEGQELVAATGYVPLMTPAISP